MSAALLSQTRRALDEDLDRMKEAGYKPPSSPNGNGDWRVAYEQERLRLAKLLVLYRDLQDEARSLEERLAQVQTRQADVTPAPPRTARRRARRRAGPFEINGYTLYRATAPKRGGGTRRFFFFAKSRPKAGRPSSVPPEFEVRTTRSGLPVLRRTGRRPGQSAGTRVPGTKTRPPRSQTRPTPASARRGLTPKKARALAYAREMKRLRARARRARGGTGPIASRASAKRLRAKYGYPTT